MIYNSYGRGGYKGWGRDKEGGRSELIQAYVPGREQDKYQEINHVDLKGSLPPAPKVAIFMAPTRTTTDVGMGRGE